VTQTTWKLDRDGFCWDQISLSATHDIARICDLILAQEARSFGIRDVLSNSAELRRLALEAMLPLAQKYLHSEAFVVRATLFDKPSDANWSVPWHQDVTIEVAERFDVQGFGPWSIKDGLLSVQPPHEVLERMVTLRLHLDSTNSSNGALLVDPGSHTKGKLRIMDIIPTKSVSCDCEAGDVLVMNPLLFHASNRSKTTKSRRVLHLDFASEPLPAPLNWRVN
jgi:ectoine hydroxylase-related dioxygenase (phytanoyl-CoA dioxygenase family)